MELAREDLYQERREGRDGSRERREGSLHWIRERKSLECLEKGLFGVFLIVWIWILSLLFLRSVHDLSVEHTVHLDYDTFENKTNTGGPYQVFKSTIYLGGLTCGQGQNALVYYPSDSNLRTETTSRQKFPLISFAHGFRAGGYELHQVYSSLLVGLASWGFIVVAPESGLNKYCLDQYQDQLRVFDYLQKGDKRSHLFASLDHSALYGVLGHSMGGRSTIISATKENYPIGAAAALHPTYTQAAPHVQVSPSLSLCLSRLLDSCPTGSHSLRYGH
jgi:hypothetical protein